MASSTTSVAQAARPLSRRHDNEACLVSVAGSATQPYHIRHPLPVVYRWADAVPSSMPTTTEDRLISRADQPDNRHAKVPRPVSDAPNASQWLSLPLSPDSRSQAWEIGNPLSLLDTRQPSPFSDTTAMAPLHVTYSVSNNPSENNTPHPVARRMPLAHGSDQHHGQIRLVHDHYDGRVVRSSASFQVCYPGATAKRAHC